MPIVSDEYKAKKRNEIIEHALVCFAEKGFQAATIDDIVRHSKISKGSIYTYFKSKEEIYITMMNEKTERSTNILREELHKYSSAIEKLTYVFDVYKSQVGERWTNTVKVHTEFYLHASRDVELRKLLVDRAKNFYNSVIIDIIEEGKKSGEFTTSSDSDVLSRLFWSIINGVGFQYSALEKEYPYEEVIEEAKKMFINALK